GGPRQRAAVRAGPRSGVEVVPACDHHGRSAVLDVDAHEAVLWLRPSAVFLGDAEHQPPAWIDDAVGEAPRALGRERARRAGSVDPVQSPGGEGGAEEGTPGPG